MAKSDTTTFSRKEALERNRAAQTREMSRAAPTVIEHPSTAAAVKERTKDGRLIIYLHEYDHMVLASVLLLLGFGLIMVLSSSYYIAMTSPNLTTFSFFISQARAAVIGLLLLGVMAWLRYDSYLWLSFLAYIISCVLVVATKYIGVESHGATRWIQVPVFGQFQPSELMKASLILFLAYFICKHKSGNRTKTFGGVIMCVVITVVPALLVFNFNNNMSTALIIMGIGLGITFIACPHVKVMLGTLAAGAGAAFAAGYYLVNFVTEPSQQFFRWAVRIRGSIDPWSDPAGTGFQTIQSLFAVASGGLLGLGLGQSNQKLKYMPEPQNDFIFAIICEELGFIGAFAVLFLFGVLIWRGARIATKAPNLVSCLIVTGIIAQISVQVIINVMVVTNTGINTGVPMPFISAGGTSLLVVMGLMGIMLNISRFVDG
jgi:cell division protein FtsW